jgi:hypothetical protein
MQALGRHLRLSAGTIGKIEKIRLTVKLSRSEALPRNALPGRLCLPTASCDQKNRLRCFREAGASLAVRSQEEPGTEMLRLGPR